mmetsp:Transcript_130614/g.418799  ORF Transcript_130614/g.418799 Transcript_130614/m.418799 type:complete len:219 (+) Transcript_130614:780-1436(+)
MRLGLHEARGTELLGRADAAVFWHVEPIDVDLPLDGNLGRLARGGETSFVFGAGRSLALPLHRRLRPRHLLCAAEFDHGHLREANPGGTSREGAPLGEGGAPQLRAAPLGDGQEQRWQAHVARAENGRPGPGAGAGKVEAEALSRAGLGRDLSDDGHQRRGRSLCQRARRRHALHHTGRSGCETGVGHAVRHPTDVAGPPAEPAKDAALGATSSREAK